MKTKRGIKKAKKGLEIVITSKHIKNAKPGDSCNCVVAQALQDKFGEIIDGVIVGPRKTKIFLDNGGAEWQYKTPKILRDQLPVFDKTEVWNLPPGPICLLPCPTHNPDSAGKRHDLANPKRGGKFAGGRAYIPSRKATINFG